MIIRSLLLLAALLGACIADTHKNVFREGERVDKYLRVNKLTSTKTLFPVDFYKLPFYVPEEGPKAFRQNLGNNLAGDRIQSAPPFDLRMKTDIYCKKLCITNLGREELQGLAPNKVVRAIRLGYHHNWLLDNLPSASKYEDDTLVTVRLMEGFPVGFANADTRKAYIHNHFNFEIHYHEDEQEPNTYSIVRFIIQPFSVKHEFEPNFGSEDMIAKIRNPIASCEAQNLTDILHTSYDMIVAPGQEPQPASGITLFTYDVIWVNNKNLEWKYRWDVYLTMDGALSAHVHWTAILVSTVGVVILGGCSLFLWRQAKEVQYRRLNTFDEEASQIIEPGSAWYKLLHGNIFKPPKYAAQLAVFCGTGAHLLVATFVALTWALTGLLSASNRGVLIMALIESYVLTSFVRGYVSARVYKTFGGNWNRLVSFWTALLFPSLLVAFFVLVQVEARTLSSTLVVPLTTLVATIPIHAIVSVLLSIGGSRLGKAHGAVAFPVKAEETEGPVHMRGNLIYRLWPLTSILGGILPYGFCYVEFYYISLALWKNWFYETYGFLILITFLAVLTAAAISVLFTYANLSFEQYHWWWPAFLNAGGTAFWTFIGASFFALELELELPAAHWFYFGAMALISLGIFLVLGFVGVASSFYFNKTVYRMLGGEAK